MPLSEEEELEYLRLKKAKAESSSPGVGIGMVRSALQGMTFGGSDEIGSAIAALPASIQTGEPYGDVYGKMMDQLKTERQAFRQEHPVLSTGSEIAGGVGTGIAGATKVAGTKAGQQLMQYLPKWLQAAGIGATEGGIYGALSADPGERIVGGATGAGIGAVAAPTMGYAVEKLGQGAGGLFRWAKNKLSSTPKTEAIRALRAALEAEGLDADDAVRIYDSLGSEGMLADVGENFRALLRAATDAPGGAKAAASDALRSRQLGQGQRLLSAAEEAVGRRARELPMTVSQITQQRAQQAAPLYEQAYRQGINMTDDLSSVLSRDGMKSALRKAKSIASNYGDEFSEGSLKHLHYAKMALWDQISAAERQGNRQSAAALKRTYGDLLDEIGKQNKTYGRANAIWSDDSKLLDAAMEGRRFMRMSAADMNDAVNGLTKGEREMFQLGAMASVQDMLDNTQMTNDATRKFINSTGMLKKLSMLFDSEEAARSFLEKAQAEQAFVRTRNVVAGGSPTSQNLRGQQFLQDAVQPESIVDMMANPMGAALKIAKDIVTEKGLSPQTLNELGSVLMKKGMTEDEIRKLLASPRFAAMVERTGIPSRAIPAPAIEAYRSE